MDAETAEKLYKTYYLSVYSYAMTLTKNRPEAEDLAEETFLRAMTATAPFREDADLFTYLCAIAKNLFYNAEKKKKKQAPLPTDDQPDDAADFTEALIDEEQSLRIHTVLHAMEEPYREVFSLRVFGELSFRKIGTVFGKTETWARVTYHRAVLKIRERM